MVNTLRDYIKPVDVSLGTLGTRVAVLIHEK